MIEVTSLLKTFEGGAVRAVDDISFTVPAGSVLTLLGPSGCGKTTTMRSIAGLEKPDSGELKVGEKVVYSSRQKVNLRPNRRNVGMVFQSYAIWPHMTVFDNVSYPLKGETDRAALRERTVRALRLVDLEHLADRRAPKLSGGQQQRVALARALVAEPDVLLLDEPLSNLDAKLRDTMRKEIRELQQSLDITTLYVTHDQSEALAISDLVAVMSQGQIVDFGDPERIYSKPRSRAVADFIGMANVVDVSGIRISDGWWLGDSGLGPLVFQGEGDTPHSCSVLIRLEDLQLVGPEEADEANVWPGNVVSVLYLGGYWDCVIDVNGQRLRSQVPRRQRPSAGDRVYVRVSARSCYVLPEDESQPILDADAEEHLAAESSTS
ncbi:MAG: ATP-binding cassette domain-containing protein [Propionibacteriales bacterium]|nr:ATP-binding cassette domain-containing protein [Propionibacteriales bacterium]